jgi:hypothetical protein
MTRADVCRKFKIRQLESERVTLRVGVFDPATQLRQSCFDTQSGQRIPIEAMRCDGGARVQLHM